MQKKEKRRKSETDSAITSLEILIQILFLRHHFSDHRALWSEHSPSLWMKTTPTFGWPITWMTDHFWNWVNHPLPKLAYLGRKPSQWFWFRPTGASNAYNSTLNTATNNVRILQIRVPELRFGQLLLHPLSIPQNHVFMSCNRSEAFKSLKLTMSQRDNIHERRSS